MLKLWSKSVNYDHSFTKRMDSVTQGNTLKRWLIKRRMEIWWQCHDLGNVFIILSKFSETFEEHSQTICSCLITCCSSLYAIGVSCKRFLQCNMLMLYQPARVEKVLPNLWMLWFSNSPDFNSVKYFFSYVDRYTG